MAKKKKTNNLTAMEEIKLEKLKIFFTRPVLKAVLRILTMEHGAYRNIKTLRNINRLFSNLDPAKYKSDPYLRAYIWCICHLSKLWIDGVVTPDIAIEVLRTDSEWNELCEEAISSVIDDNYEITPAEAQSLFNLITNALQLGYFVNIRDEYINLFEGLDPNDVSSLPEIANRIFQISRSVLDIRYSTDMISNKVEFNTGNPDSILNGISKTIDSLSGDGCIIRTGIRRLNSMLSPGYMDGSLTVYCGTPAGGKSIMLLKTVLDARMYNLNFKPKTPGMKPAALYITMENTFEQTIERLWNMCFDQPITSFSKEEATKKICNILGVSRGINGNNIVYSDTDKNNPYLTNKEGRNIEIIIQYYSYRSISTEDIFTIIQDLREDGYEVVIFVLDYIKRIAPSVPIYDNVKMELSRIVNELKAIAVIYRIPVVTAHQLNRNAAEAIDNAARKGKGDLLKEAGRNNIGDAWEVFETADTIIYTNREKKPMTDDIYQTLAAQKRRRLDNTTASKYDYFAHPYSKVNGLRLLDDVDKPNTLSIQSLVTDIDPLTINDQTSAVPRLKMVNKEDFVFQDLES